MSIESADPAASSIFTAEWWTPRLAGPVIAAAVVRFALLAVTLVRNGISPLLNPDTSTYLEPGRNLLLHGRFVADGVPNLLRTPGYSLFLAITSLAGLPAAAVVNVILSVFSVILIWRLGRTVFADARIALGAAWIFAFEPISTTNSVVLLSDTLFLALLLLSLERLAAFLRGRRLRMLAVAGLWLAAATFVRPVTYYLPVALAVGLFIMLARVPGLRWKAPALLLISVLPWLAAWQIRNWIETGYSGFSSAEEINLYFNDATYVTGSIEHRSFMDVRDEWGYSDYHGLWLQSSGQIYLTQTYLALHPEQAGWSQGQRLAFLHSEALRVIRAHYAVLLRSCLISSIRTMFEVGAGRFDRLLFSGDTDRIANLQVDAGPANWWRVLAKAPASVLGEKAAFAIVVLGLYLLAARGLFLAARGAFRGDMHNACLWLLLGTSLYFLILSSAAGVAGSDARYRLPVIPVICILAGAGFRADRRSCNKHRIERLRCKSEWWTPRLAGPVIAAAVVRFALLAVTLARNGISPLLNPDTSTYLEPGRNLLLHGRFVADGVPDIFRTPGYSLFLAITSLAGLPAAAVANVILSVFSVILVWRLGQAVTGNGRIALIAAWIFAFEPVSATWSCFLVSETLFLVIFLLSLERLAAFLRGHHLPVLAAAGLWLVAATFVRPVTYYLPVALAVGLFVVLTRVKGLRWKAPAVLLISVLPWLAAWQIRNWVETGYSGFSSVSEENLYFFIAPDVTGHLEHRSYIDVRNEQGFPDFKNLWILSSGQIYLSQPYLARHPEQAGWSQGQRLAFLHSEALRVIRAHYGIYVRLCIKSVFRTLFEFGEGSLNLLVNPESPVHPLGLTEDQSIAREAITLTGTYPWEAAKKAVFAVFLLGLYLFAARGVFRGGLHNACLWLLLGTSLYFIAVTGVAGAGRIGSERFRLSVMPAVCILAAAGFRRAKTIAR